MTKTNSISIRKGTTVQVLREGDDTQRQFVTREEAVFEPSDWSCKNGIVVAKRTDDKGIVWSLIVPVGEGDIVPHLCAVNWTAASAAHDRVHAAGQGHNLHEVMRVREIARRESARKVVDFASAKEARALSSDAVSREVDRATMDSVSVDALDLLGDLGVVRLTHLARRGGLSVISAYLVPSSGRSGRDAYIVEVVESKRGCVLRVDCGCTRALGFHKACSHSKRARRAHQRRVNAQCLLEAGVDAIDIPEMLRGAVRNVSCPAGPSSLAG